MLLMAGVKDTPDTPDDLMLASAAAKEFNIPYTRIRAWWQRGSIRKWNRGPKRRPVYVRRSDIERMNAFHQG